MRADGPPIRVIVAGDELDEARQIAREVRRLRRPGGRWSAIAVLARTNAQLPAIAAALADAGVPQRITASDGPGAPTTTRSPRSSSPTPAP